MKVVLSLCFSFICLSMCFAQDLILTPLGETLCLPGVINKSPSKGLNLEYGLNPNVSLRSENSTSNSEPTKIDVNHRYTIKLKAPILNKEKFKMLIGWNYYGELYNFDEIGIDNAQIFNTINGKHLKSSRISLYLVKPINHKYYFALKAVASYNGDYKGMFNFDKRYARYDVATIFGIKKRSNLEWGVGLLFRKNFNNSFPVIPFAIYNHTFNSKWGIETTIPTSFMLRHNISDKHNFLIGPQFESRIYSINVEDEVSNELDPFHMRRSEWRLALRYQRNIKSWLWTEAATGYVQNFNTRFEEIENGTDPDPIRVKPSNGVFFKLGLFLSPPKDKLKKMMK